MHPSVGGFNLFILALAYFTFERQKRKLSNTQDFPMAVFKITFLIANEVSIIIDLNAIQVTPEKQIHFLLLFLY